VNGRRSLVSRFAPAGGLRCIDPNHLRRTPRHPADTNHRGQVYAGAGVATITAFDFKGFPTQEQLQLVEDPKTTPDWTDLLEEDRVRSGHPTYDASKFHAVTEVEDPFGNACLEFVGDAVREPDPPGVGEDEVEPPRRG
jgi:hypothetical protein